MNFSIIQKSQLEEVHRLDPEYFQPKYLELDKSIKEQQFSTLEDFGCKVVSGPFGSSLKSDVYLEKGIPFIRVSNLQDFFINEDDLVCISEEDNHRLKQSQLNPFDLVISKVGNTIGVVSAIPEELGVCNISENNIGIKFKDANTTLDQKLFLLTFLNSKLGYLQVIRNISGNAQPKLNISNIAQLLIPTPQEKLLSVIKELIISAKKTFDDSKIYYQQAEDLLLEKLGLKNFQIENDLSFVVNLSDVKSVNRIDAEYFHPKYQKLVEQIKKHNAKLLGDLVSMKKGFEPGSKAYQEEGKLFIRVSSLSKFGIEDKDQKYLSEELYKRLQNDFEPKIGEVLLTKDATPGIAYVLKEAVEGIISGGILRLKVKDNIDPEYLALCISSVIGQWQAERDAGGSIIAHWKPEQIKNLLIPILPKTTQEKIAELVRKSHEARKKSKELLEEAKRKVEEMVEKGGES
ncbi:MAG: restriction endonuclease subunit S [Candidatus Daviesbacteria bacterium]|nr:restriction endonuclease subunit S [Candidatus Daviesbacteria bacterium]